MNHGIAAAVARWRRQARARPRSHSAPGRYVSPPLVPGLPIVYRPSIVASALYERLRGLGVGTALLPEYLRLAGLEPTAAGLTWARGTWVRVRCPRCGGREKRWLRWHPATAAFCCGGCHTQHGPACVGGRFACRWHQTPHLDRWVAEYLFACRMGAGALARVRYWRVQRSLARALARGRGLHGEAWGWSDGLRFARFGQALAYAAPPVPRRRLTAGPLAARLAGELLEALVTEVYSVPAYTARARRELAAGVAVLA